MDDVGAGCFAPGAHVSEVRLVMVDDGTCSRARFELEYASGNGPASVFGKAKGDWYRRVLQLATSNALIEGRLFASGIELPIEHPQAFAASVEANRLNDLVLLEDLLLRGATMNDATTPMGVDEVLDGLRGLAALHSRYWRLSSTTEPALDWVRPWRSTRSFRALLRFGCGRGLTRLSDAVGSEVAALGATGMTSAWDRYVRSVSHAPIALLHGDAHVGNTYSLPDGTVGFLDWGVVRRGHWSFDVGYFIVSSLSVEDRRERARDLVEAYRDALEVPEGDLPTEEEAWLRVRSSPAYGLAIWVTTGSEDGYQSPEVCRNLSERFAAAFTDMSTLDALDRLGV